MLVAGGWWLVAGCWWLVAAGCWLLVAGGCWWLVAAGPINVELHQQNVFCLDLETMRQFVPLKNRIRQIYQEWPNT